MNYQTILTWITAHPMETAVVCYVLLNLSRRIPPPKSPRMLALWKVFESCMVLGWERFGGPLKTLPSVTAWQAEAPTKAETPSAKAGE